LEVSLARHSDSILELARRGAEVRYRELQDELSALVKQFPGLRSAATEMARRGRRAVNAAVTELRGNGEVPARRKRTLSPTARKAISDAQKARWAKQKAQQKSPATQARRRKAQI
jgi:hypothetical protein